MVYGDTLAFGSVSPSLNLLQGLERWPSGLEHLVLSQKIQVQFLEPTR